MTKATVVIISGLSGSGKTVALRALEDVGFFCVDNLPITLVDIFIAHLAEEKDVLKIGIGIDIREQTFLLKFSPTIETLREKYNVEIIFLEAEIGILARRYKETRRPHPLYAGISDIDKAINKEKRMLLILRKEADRIIDTSSYTPHQLRQLITSLYKGVSISRRMSLTLLSFGYKYGVPLNADLLFDVRFLPNPHFIPKLKDLTGLNKAVKKFVLDKKDTKNFIKKLKSFLDFLVPMYIKEGRSYLTIGIGCTGGKHRAPAIAEKIKKMISQHSVDISVIHREI
ncbi:MAG: RNase adapter RapZ [Nitrospiraceae bacterium]|nr:RNase adapter RapZ [Nitrospiraceae bacterium]